MTDTTARKSNVMDEQTVADLKQAICVSEIDDRGTSKVPAADLLAELTELGYALVKLPGEEVDEWGSTHWAVEGDRFSQVKIGHDGRISVLGVPFAMTDPAQARSLAAALLAAAQHIKDENQ
ncbi:hypothetical protein IU451_28840 [Nocardia cyriacigeorgica]|uniref:hypothetical protein n=1 Tax=Nocardia cyriacigeorgica TaxID=135487 RepID=UPI001893A48F|nr:hypothetical protein [Nocardia cyriacigeorgica]MBF6326510.1 hypothetical protein [Nocardia cyriacigeorgica]